MNTSSSNIDWAEPEKAREAIILGRDRLVDDPALWQSLLDYFSAGPSEANLGFFAGWFCLSLTVPERGQTALRALFGKLCRTTHLDSYLGGLEKTLNEPRFSLQRRWIALQGPLLTELASSWRHQASEVESYSCSHNTVAHFARVFLPALQPSGREKLALACLEALARHRQPPGQGHLCNFPEALARDLPAEAVPILVGILREELPGIAELDFKPYKRKTDRLSPSGHAALQSCLNVITTCTWHPEWANQIAAEVSPHPLAGSGLRKVIELLDTLWLTRWARQPEEAWETYLSRQAPLTSLFEPERTP